MFEVHDAQGGGFFWTLKSPNHERLCHSEVYTTKQSALAGIAAVKRVAPEAPTRDYTESRRAS